MFWFGAFVSAAPTPRDFIKLSICTHVTAAALTKRAGPDGRRVIIESWSAPDPISINLVFYLEISMGRRKSITIVMQISDGIIQMIGCQTGREWEVEEDEAMVGNSGQWGHESGWFGQNTNRILWNVIIRIKTALSNGPNDDIVHWMVLLLLLLLLILDYLLRFKGHFAGAPKARKLPHMHNWSAERESNEDVVVWRQEKQLLLYIWL